MDPAHGVAAHFKLQTFSFGKENGHLDMAKDIMRCPSAFEKHLAIEVKLPDSNLPMKTVSGPITEKGGYRILGTSQEVGYSKWLGINGL